MGVSFQAADLVKAVVISGKKVGEYIGRTATGAKRVFEKGQLEPQVQLRGAYPGGSALSRCVS
jgi:hypothetical protein